MSNWTGRLDGAASKLPRARRRRPPPALPPRSCAIGPDTLGARLGDPLPAARESPGCERVDLPDSRLAAAASHGTSEAENGARACAGFVPSVAAAAAWLVPSAPAMIGACASSSSTKAARSRTGGCSRSAGSPSATPTGRRYATSGRGARARRGRILGSDCESRGRRLCIDRRLALLKQPLAQ